MLTINVESQDMHITLFNFFNVSKFEFFYEFLTLLYTHLKYKSRN